MATRPAIPAPHAALDWLTAGVYHRYMPSPRFSRLAAERRSTLLSVARGHFARAGSEAASYNRIIADAGISKTTAYMYFDGKQDLVGEVLRDVYARLGDAMGPWRAAGAPDLFWDQLAATSDVLRRHLLAHPDDLALLAEHGVEEVSELDAWFGEMLDNGVGLGVIRTDVGRPLLLAATVALFRVIDDWALAALARGESVDPAPAWHLLRGLWGSAASPPAGAALPSP